MANNTLTYTIKERFPNLSSGQKKVAEFLLQHKYDSALLTAFQLGRKVGVSETTVIRFSYSLGFRGYSEMQEQIRKEWLVDHQHVETENESTKTTHDKENIFKKVIDQEKSILQQLLQQLDTDELWKAVEELIQADKVYIGGFGSSHAASYWFYYTLKQLRKNVYLSSPTGFLPEDICELGENSVVVIFSYPRYRKESLQLANLSIEQEAKIIAITNRQLSPIGQLASITLTSEEYMESGHHSIASVVSLLEVIIVGIQSRDREKISIRQQKLEQLYTEQGLFLE
ncbi:MurR/RpiR family transcriptional regulator [Bacillus sp. Marseille-Q3570]|uniref:MurR/RpiR family transcriptional regulator n=1 Tax=Bacillus sp. Marseille-Q3570 TaxID=2963522 RepID=UPI0021B7E2AF|nr:MurR/RpiR family transcriptional regulator [Bacillus sp. Marseille-Q3570]